MVTRDAVLEGVEGHVMPAEQTLRTARWLGLIGWGLLLSAYTALFFAFSDSNLFSSVQRALFNTLPAALLSWPVARLVERHLIDTSLIRQIACHFALGVGFAMFWYIGLQVGYGLQNGLPEGGIIGRPLMGVALAWQMFQGMTLYAVVALFTYAVVYRTRLDLLQAERQADILAADMSADIEQIFVKDGKALKPVRLSDIFCLSGAGDYSEIITRDGTFLSTTPLSQFETDLPDTLFLRVHRSHIVALNAVLSIEPGGNGRLTIHLPKGHSVTTSRAGATRLKDRTL